MVVRISAALDGRNKETWMGEGIPWWRVFVGGNSVEMSDYPRRASLVHSFGGEDILTTCLTCAFSLRLQGCEIYALVMKANLVVS